MQWLDHEQIAQQFPQWQAEGGLLSQCDRAVHRIKLVNLLVDAVDENKVKFYWNYRVKNVGDIDSDRIVVTAGMGSNALLTPTLEQVIYLGSLSTWRQMLQKTKIELQRFALQLYFCFFAAQRVAGQSPAMGFIFLVVASLKANYCRGAVKSNVYLLAALWYIRIKFIIKNYPWTLVTVITQN